MEGGRQKVWAGKCSHRSTYSLVEIFLLWTSGFCRSLSVVLAKTHMRVQYIASISVGELLMKTYMDYRGCIKEHGVLWWEIGSVLFPARMTSALYASWETFCPKMLTLYNYSRQTIGFIQTGLIPTMTLLGKRALFNSIEMIGSALKLKRKM